MSRLSLIACAGLATVLYVGYSDPAATQFILAQTGEAGDAPKTLLEDDTVTGGKSESDGDASRQIETEARPGGPSIVAPKAERLEIEPKDEGAPAAAEAEEQEEQKEQQAAPAEPEKRDAPEEEEEAAPEPAERIAPKEEEAAPEPAQRIAPEEEEDEEQAAPAEAAKPAESAEDDSEGEDEKEPAAAAKAPSDEVDGKDDESEVSAVAKPGKSEFAPGDRDIEPGKVADVATPQEESGIAAFAMLDKHCARCHQSGKLKRQKPAKNFGNVLDLDAIANDASLILPGNPEGSPLFISITKNDMPYDCYQEAACDTGDVEEPTKEEVQALYDWIKSLAGAPCGNEPIHEEAIVEAISEDIDAQQDHRQQGMRYITLSHLYNACAKEKDMIRYRQGVVKLLNSLSRESDVLSMRTIDEHKTIIAFNLEDLKWTEEDWNKLIAIYPYGMAPDSNDYEGVKEITKTPLSWVRGDWFAYSAARPPLYHDLLKLPDTFQGLEKQLDVDSLKNVEKLLAKRSGFQDSGVSAHNRLIERHSINTGYFWTSYDFGGDKSEQSLFSRPLGPKGDNAFKHDGGESIFSLPNGFQGYYLTTAEGKRLDKGPVEIVLDQSQRDHSVTNGISCMGCHNQGIRKKADEIRNHVLADRTFSREVRDQVEALYPPVKEMDRIFEQDFARFNAAMERAGLDSELDSQQSGVESINFLAQHYEKAVDLRIVAAEFGLKPDVFSGSPITDSEAFRTRRQLEQGVVPRETIEDQFKDFIEFVSDYEPIKLEKDDGKDKGKKDEVADKDDGKKDEVVEKLIVKKDEVVEKFDVAKVGDKTKEETHDFGLSLISDKSDYHVDDHPVFSVKAEENCHLTLINVDAAGEGTVIYPNKFQQDNFLKAGKEFTFPDEHAPFQFRMKDKGIETVIAICDTGKKASDGIEHDFKTRQFTDLGDYREFLTRAIVVEGKEKIAEVKKVIVDDAPKGKESFSARTAIKLHVE